MCHGFKLALEGMYGSHPKRGRGEAYLDGVNALLGDRCHLRKWRLERELVWITVDGILTTGDGEVDTDTYSDTESR